MIKTRLSWLLAVLFYLPLTTYGQKYNINNDTVKVSASSFPFLRFLGEVQSANLLCEDYKIVRTTTTITIRPKNSKPGPLCMLLVSEGSQSSPRQHTFILSYVKDVPAAELLHDYSTKGLMEKRVEYLQNQASAKGAPDEGGKPDKQATAEAPKKAKGGMKLPKFGKAPKVEAPEAPKTEVPEAPKKPETKALAAEKKKPAPAAQEENTRTDSRQEDRGSAGATEGNSDAGSEEDGEIKNIPMDKLEERVKLKINSFYDACGLLCAKKDIDESIKYAMKLFNNDESVLVETTNGKTNAKSQKKIRPYLDHLSQLKYSKVEMTTSEIRFVSNFHLGPDKKWHASAVIIQDFNGYKDGVLAYSDKTNKTIDIIVNIFDVIKDGKVIKKFDIFLGNISVTNIP